MTATRIRTAVAVAAAALAALTAGTVATRPATAIDSNCTRVQLSTSKAVNRYVPVAGWGWTAWRVSPTITAYDRCDHGALGVLVSTYDGAVRAKGGTLGVDWVRYLRSDSSSWTYVPFRYAWPSWYFSAPHVDMVRSSRIKYVQIRTVVRTRQDASGSVPIAYDTLTCNLVARTCS